jgi:hypothetical protein
MATDARQLGNGEIGYCMEPTRTDDCLRPAIATVLQVPPCEIPDPRIDERMAAGNTALDVSREGWAELRAWLAHRGLEIAIHEPFPDRERWIGVARIPWIADAYESELQGMPVPQGPADELLAKFDVFIASEWLNYMSLSDHCLVMCRDAVHFDPAVGLQPPPGQRLRTYDPSEIVYAITIDPLKELNQ